MMNQLLPDSESIDNRRNSARFEVIYEPFSDLSGQGKYECRVVIVPDDEDGGFCVYALRLPGVASQGETETEAIENIRDAFGSALATYLELGMPIPWEDSVAVPQSASRQELWIVVDVEQ
jgi:predicted RNase H-like HicB family nuclease